MLRASLTVLVTLFSSFSVYQYERKNQKYEELKITETDLLILADGPYDQFNRLLWKAGGELLSTNQKHPVEVVGGSLITFVGNGICDELVAGLTNEKKYPQEIKSGRKILELPQDVLPGTVMYRPPEPGQTHGHVAIFGGYVETPEGASTAPDDGTFHCFIRYDQNTGYNPSGDGLHRTIVCEDSPLPYFAEDYRVVFVPK
jgi:hypothetical protein